MTNPSQLQRYAVLSLAVTATSIGVGMASSMAWGRSVVLTEQILNAAMAAFVVVAAHLLPSVIRAGRKLLRAVVCSIWILCMTWIVYGHASFSLRALASAGELRVAAAAQPEFVAPNRFTPKRSLVEVAEEEAKLQTELFRLNQKVCHDNCGRNQAQRVSLTARIRALDIESEEVRRWQAERDYQLALAKRERNHRDAARHDPVMARLADGSNVTVTQRLELTIALILALALEGAACLFWWEYLRSRKSAPVTSMTAQESERTAGTQAANAEKPEDPVVMRVRHAIRTGKCDGTVRSIRDHLGCAQSKAAAIRKTIVDMAV